MKEIKVNARFKIGEGHLDEFKQLIPQFISTVEDNDPGTLNYDWYLNEDRMECVVLETYANSNALLAHAGNVGELLGKVTEISELKIEIYGNPNEELLKMAKSMRIKIFPYYDGL